MSVESILEEIGEEQGWNDASKLALVCQYLDNQQDDSAFADFLRQQQENENGDLFCDEDESDPPRTFSNSYPLRPGDTVVWDQETLNMENTSEEDRIKYYGDLGYGQEKPVLFTFVCHHHPQNGHCVLINMSNQKVETMRHTSEFRLVEEDEC